MFNKIEYHNNRSMLGERDSEVAIHAKSPYFAESLRKRIWSVALGCSVMGFTFAFILVLNFYWSTTAWYKRNQDMLTRRDRPRDPQCSIFDCLLHLVRIILPNWNFQSIRRLIRCTIWKTYFWKILPWSRKKLQFLKTKIFYVFWGFKCYKWK